MNDPGQGRDETPARPPRTPEAGRPYLLSIRNLAKTFRQRTGFLAGGSHFVRALDSVSLDIPRGGMLGLVGESGSGKSTLGRCVLRLTEPTSGEVIWRERDGHEIAITDLDAGALRRFRRRMQMIFQDPYHSLNPSRPVWQIVGEGLIVNGAEDRRSSATEHGTEATTFRLSRRELRDRAAAMLEAVGLSPDHLDRLPHEFSGGQRQRIAIARALIVEPEFLVCDEVTSALDTRTQAQVLDLLRQLQARTGVTLLFISHDLHTVASMCEEVVVMRAGRIVERGSVRDLFSNPQHEYTRTLINAIPNPDPRRRTFRQRTV